MTRFTSDDLESKRWRETVLDVRLAFTFYGREEDLDGTTLHTYRNTAAGSGGEQEKLVAFCLAAALSYNLADADSDGKPRFAPLMLGEAFSKSDETSASQALAAFDEFGFQLIMAAPSACLACSNPSSARRSSSRNASVPTGPGPTPRRRHSGNSPPAGGLRRTASAMRQPDEITTSMRARFERDYPDWARGRGTWPIRIPLKPPTSAERSTDPVTCHTWAKLWDLYTGTGTIERSTLRFPTGLHAMPKTLVLDSPLAAASIHPSTRETWIRCGERLMHLQRAFPKARFDRVIRRLTEMDADDFQRLVATVSWLDGHPTSGLMLRQLPIEGVDTKWLGKNKSLVLALLALIFHRG